MKIQFKLTRWLEKKLPSFDNITDDRLLYRIFGSLVLSSLCIVGPIITLLGWILLPLALIVVLFDKLHYLIFGSKKYKQEILGIKSKVNAYYNDKFIENYYLQDYTHGYFINDLEFFIKWFVQYGRDRYHTYGSTSNKHICDKGRRRSTGDIYLICKHYYPECTLEEVIAILIQLIEKGDIYGSYCNTIHKFVYYIGSTHVNLEGRTEYGVKYSDIIKAYKQK